MWNVETPVREVSLEFQQERHINLKGLKAEDQTMTLRKGAVTDNSLPP